MIVDDSFYSLKEQMIVHDSFSASSLVKDRLKPHSNPKWLPRCCQLQTNRVTILTKVITRRVHVCGTFFAMITQSGCYWKSKEELQVSLSQRNIASNSLLAMYYLFAHLRSFSTHIVICKNNGYSFTASHNLEI